MLHSCRKFVFLLREMLPARVNKDQLSRFHLGSSDAFAQAIADFSEAYAEQTNRDHAVLVAAIKEGHVPAETDFKGVSKARRKTSCRMTRQLPLHRRIRACSVRGMERLSKLWNRPG